MADTGVVPRAAFDDIEVLVKNISRMPYALVTLSGSHEEFFRSRFGVHRTRTEDLACCTEVVRSRAPLVVADLAASPFARSTLVTRPPHYRSYVGVPLIDDDGSAIGTLGALDVVVREESTIEVALLEVIAREATRHLQSARLQVQLEDEQARYRDLVQKASIATIVHQQGHVVFANDGALSFFGGHRASDIVGREMLDFVPGRLRDRYRERVEEVLVGSHVTMERTKVVRLDGAEVTVDVYSVPVLFDGQPAVQVQMIDVTDRAEVDRKLRLSEARFRALFDHAPIGQIEAGLDGIIMSVNPYLCSMVGYGADELMGQHVSVLYAAEALEGSFNEYAELIAGKITHYVVQRRFLRKDGSQLTSLVSTAAVLGADGSAQRLIKAVFDITDLSANEARLRHQLDHDPLTGLANRSLLLQQTTSALSEGRTAVIYVDLDDFKVVNDLHGHHVGDAALVEVARRISEVVRPVDLVARLGGDEFVVLCPDIAGEDQAVAIRDRIDHALQQPMVHEGQALSISGSVGVALAEQGRSAALILEDADIAMYRQKRRRGRT
jgi:diguanylate cyclase (GGDEF)-like protein/PAS domain S-box-containing protein